MCREEVSEEGGIERICAHAVFAQSGIVIRRCAWLAIT